MANLLHHIRRTLPPGVVAPEALDPADMFEWGPPLVDACSNEFWDHPERTGRRSAHGGYYPFDYQPHYFGDHHAYYAYVHGPHCYHAAGGYGNVALICVWCAWEQYENPQLFPPWDSYWPNYDLEWLDEEALLELDWREEVAEYLATTLSPPEEREVELGAQDESCEDLAWNEPRRQHEATAYDINLSRKDLHDRRRRNTHYAHRRRLVAANYGRHPSEPDSRLPHQIRNTPVVRPTHDDRRRPDRRSSLLLNAQIIDAGDELAADE